MILAPHHLVVLCDALSTHQGVTHWAVSMRALGKGDFFARLKSGAQQGCKTQTAERLSKWFSENWPDDLAWPNEVPRPVSLKKSAPENPSQRPGSLPATRHEPAPSLPMWRRLLVGMSSRAMRELMGDIVGALALFVMLFGGLIFAGVCQ